MNTKTKMDVPDIGNLLGKITDKQGKGELGTTDRQKVVPVSELKRENEKSGKQNNGQTVAQENDLSISRNSVKTQKQENEKTGGRPSTKSKDIEYVRIGAVIPKAVRKAMERALTDEVFSTKDGKPFSTFDQVVTLALEKLLPPKK